MKKQQYAIDDNQYTDSSKILPVLSIFTYQHLQINILALF